jgi:primosomal protein N' (replication factor Y)
VIKEGKQVIMLIPEIALTYQTVMRFYNRFGDRISILNSRLSNGERYDQYERAKNGEIDIMIGPRSALFTPFMNLGLIIMDEEHEGSYKSESPPKYHARDVAIKRASLTNSSVILGSATPAIESYKNAIEGSYKLYTLPSRVGTRRMPKIWVEDLREELKKRNKSIFSTRLKELMEDRLRKKEQIMLFINRRGYAGFVSCRSCGHVMKCKHCDISLTSHNNGTLVCHYCSYEEATPNTCPACGSKYIAAFGTGTQKVEEMVKKEFPFARVLRMDTDTTKAKDGHEKILSAFSNGEADILVGTQMIVKGHDFPRVTLVGILAADLSLYASDYRASERTYQLLAQAS